MSVSQRYKVGDKFPATWDTDLFREDGDYYIEGEVEIEGKKFPVAINVSCIFMAPEPIQPLKESSQAMIMAKDEESFEITPDVWIDIWKYASESFMFYYLDEHLGEKNEET
jgi:hypothetical protein